MGQSQRWSNYAAVKDAQIKLIEEECALDTEQSANDAVVKDAQIKFNVEECAKDTGHITVTMMNQLHLDPNLR